LKGDHGESYSTLVIVEDGQELALPDAERAAFEALLPIKDKKVRKLTQIRISYSYFVNICLSVLLIICN
jgi:hypothetical protein